jgi:Na+/alanine symporter
MSNKTWLAIFAIFLTSIGTLEFTGLSIISSAVAQEDNDTLAGNLTMGAANMTDTNMTNGTGNISGVEDPF